MQYDIFDFLIEKRLFSDKVLNGSNNLKQIY